MDLYVKKAINQAFILILASYLSGCAISPEARFKRMAENLGIDARTIQGGPFRLRYLVRQGEASSKMLTIYLEGDGSPWATATRVSPEPTAREPVAFELMSRDTGNVIYLARPCYHGLRDYPCRPWYWTHGRYSAAVVDSMVTAVESLTASFPRVKAVRLVGHSGGGTLAMLMAEDLPQVNELITIAANLDTEAWTTRHGYDRLAGSLNPATRPLLPERIRQTHLFGDNDDNVPVELNMPFLLRQPHSLVASIAGQGHQCCWSDLWPAVLASLPVWPRFCAGMRLQSGGAACTPLSGPL
jgi:pimeloyl-ACP methyl ester carboxylesterase